MMALLGRILYLVSTMYHILGTKVTVLTSSTLVSESTPSLISAPVWRKKNHGSLTGQTFKGLVHETRRMSVRKLTKLVLGLATSDELEAWFELDQLEQLVPS